MTDVGKVVKEMHSLYCELTGLPIQYGADRLYPWECFCNRFTKDDLKLVVRYIQDRQRQGRPARSLNFRSLISGPCSLSSFEEDLCDAKSLALVRNKIKQQQGNLARNNALQSICRSVPQPDRVKSAAQILRGQEELQKLLALRDNL